MSTASRSSSPTPTSIPSSTTSSDDHDDTAQNVSVKVQLNEEEDTVPPPTPNVSDVSDNFSASDAQSSVSRKRPHTEVSPEEEDNTDDDSDLSVSHRRCVVRDVVKRMKDKHPHLAEHEDELVEWASASPLERGIMLYAEALITHRLVRKAISLKDVTYSISQGLNTNIQAYVWKLGFSPYLPSYKSSWAQTVLAAMHEGRVDGLPVSTNINHLSTFNSKVSDVATKVRFYIKEALEQSLGINKKKKETSDMAKCHITVLARNLANKCDFSITTEFLQRLALLRGICETYHDDSSKEDFWSYVDKKLHKYLSDKMDKPKELKSWLQCALELDLQDYPRSDESIPNYQDIVVPANNLPEIQKIVDRHARQM